MNSFYLSMIFIGIFLIITVLVLVAIDYVKSLSSNSEKSYEKKELSKLVGDAEQMADELNRLSEYIVTTVEEKTDKLADILKEVNCRIQEYGAMTGNKKESIPPAVNEAKSEVCSTLEYTDNIWLENSDQGKKEDDSVKNVNDKQEGSKPNPEIHIKNKLSRLNMRHREVMRLAEMGMSETQIARELNIGKGEIALILDINK